MKQLWKKLRITVILFIAFFYISGQNDQETVLAIEKQSSSTESVSTDEKQILPTELDLGDYESEMEVGRRQLLMVTVLPSDATNQTLSYTSSNTAVATVNGMGRITALGAGKTDITVFCEGITNKFTLTVTEKKTEKTIAATELDLGDYQTEMQVGEKQLLGVTVLPTNAAEQTLTYQSSDPSVASVNSMGRITALKIGDTKITISCGTISTDFTLQVKKAESETISVTDLDLGDCPTTLEIGTSQLLSVTVIPTDATDNTFTYKSSNKKVVTVNEIGRITGVGLGKANITVICGKVSKAFTLEVTEKSDQEIPAEDIEISDYEEELEVDKTMTLSAKVLPTDATETELVYESSDETIATVNSSGEVKALKEGAVTITITAGKVKKQIKLTIITPTSGIVVNETYLVLQPGETFSLSAKAQPAQAPQGITYRTSDSKVAAVSSQGLVTAVASGNSSILVSNGESMTAVTVIVNEPMSEEKEDTAQVTKTSEEKQYPNELTVSEYACITEEMLKYYYESKEIVTIQGEGYTYSFRGEDIVNYHNEFHTELNFTEPGKGVTFALNDGNPLFGPVQLRIDNKEKGYLYLYNEGKEKYELLQEGNFTNITLDTPGTYLIADKKLGNGGFSIFIIAGSAGIVLILAGVYIVLKKKYWFW